MKLSESLFENYYKDAYIQTADDVLSNEFSGWDDDFQFDRVQKEILRIVKLLNSDLQNCVVVTIADDDMDLLPSMNSADSELMRNRSTRMVKVNELNILCIEQQLGWNYRVYFKNDDDAKKYLDWAENKNRGQEE